MPDFTVLKNKVGPFPIYVYVGVAGVGIGLLIWRSNKRNTPELVPAPVDTSTGIFQPGEQPGMGGSIIIPNNSGGQVTGPGLSLDTNNKWQIAAERALIAKGYDPTVANNGLTRYLRGLSLNSQENAMVQEALISVGPAPYPPPPAQSPPTTTPNKVPFGLANFLRDAGSTSPNVIQYDPTMGIGSEFGNIGIVTTNGSQTLGSLAAQAYGHNLRSAWSGIWAANVNNTKLYGHVLAKDENAPIPAGIGIWIPWPPSTGDTANEKITVDSWQSKWTQGDLWGFLGEEQFRP